MIEVLAAIGGGTTLVLIILDAWLTYRLVGAMREQLAMRDRIEKLDEAFDALEVDRNGLKVELDTEREKTKTLTDRLSVAEAQRNEAQRRLRSAAEKLKEGSVDDAIRTVDAALADGMSETVPRSKEPASGDGLLDPGL